MGAFGGVKRPRECPGHLAGQCRGQMSAACGLRCILQAPAQVTAQSDASSAESQRDRERSHRFNSTKFTSAPFAHRIARAQENAQSPSRPDHLHSFILSLQFSHKAAYLVAVEEGDLPDLPVCEPAAPFFGPLLLPRTRGTGPTAPTQGTSLSPPRPARR